MIAGVEFWIRSRELLLKVILFEPKLEQELNFRDSNCSNQCKMD